MKDRDAQFGYLNDQAQAHLASGDPVVSLDAKRKELVGAHKSGGREWHPSSQPEQVKVADVDDFIDLQLGGADPYGVYDVGANIGWVSVGTDHDTAAFAVHTIGTWWAQVGSVLHPGATRLLICAGGGGSNGYRTRAWKTQARRPGRVHRPDHHRVPPTAGHLQVEQGRAPAVLPHLDELARQAPDQPRSHHRDHRRDNDQHRAERPQAELDHTSYPLGVKIPDHQMTSLETDGTLTRHALHGEWNYSPNPTQPTPRANQLN